MTVITKQPVNPIAHLTPEDIEQIGIELDAIRQDVIDARGEADAAYIRKVVDVQRKLELGSRAVLLGLDLPAGVGRRHGRPQRRQDPREHGDRAQRHARPVGLDARPEDPLDHLGVGQRVDLRGLEALAQRDPPHLHEHRRQGQRPRLRHHARRRGPALAPDVPRPAAVELRQRLLLRVRHRGLRPRARPQPADAEGEAQRGVQDEPARTRWPRSASRPPRTTSSTRRCRSRPAPSCRPWPPTSPPTWSATCGPTR